MVANRRWSRSTRAARGSPPSAMPRQLARAAPVAPRGWPGGGRKLARRACCVAAGLSKQKALRCSSCCFRDKGDGEDDADPSAGVSMRKARLRFDPTASNQPLPPRQLDRRGNMASSNRRWVIVHGPRHLNSSGSDARTCACVSSSRVG
ncbi:hypothetical protein SEVIR_1G341775v4 [Setaria viridis]